MVDQPDQLIESVYMPGSSQYQRFLTPEQFAERFGPTPATIAAVSRHFEAQGLTVTPSAHGSVSHEHFLLECGSLAR